MDDDMRWLVGLFSGTDMRFGEAVGLSAEDINLDDETPHGNITPHPWRRLKTKGSERCVPLVGKARGRLLGRLRVHLEAISYSPDIIVALPVMPIQLLLLSTSG